MKLLARGMKGLQHAKAEVERAGAHALVIKTDVANEAQVEAAAGAGLMSSRRN